MVEHTLTWKQSLAAIGMCLGGSGIVAAQLPGGVGPAGGQVQAAVKVSSVSNEDPHPTVYVWTGEVERVLDPGPNYYHFFYTGTVNPDARVPAESRVLRVPVQMDVWKENRRWIIAQLTLFYQQSNSLETTALLDYQNPGAVDQFGNPIPSVNDPLLGTAGPGFPQPGSFPGAPAAGFPGAPGAFPPAPGVGGAPGALPIPGAPGAPGAIPGAPGAIPGQPAEEFQGAPDDEAGLVEDPGMDAGMDAGGFVEDVEVPADAGGFGGFGAGVAVQFDPVAAAEWTFYYDQFVLWQYYCARNLLEDADKELLEGTAGRPPAQPENLLQAISGVLPGELSAERMRELTERPDPQEALVPIGGGGGAIDEAGMDAGGFVEDVAMDAGGALGLGGGAEAEPGSQALRERFDPTEDYQDQGKRGETYRTSFIAAAERLEEEVQQVFMGMIEGIDARALNQERYDAWLQEKRQEVLKFAEDWQKLQEGNTLLVDGTMFLVSPEPMETVPSQALNIVKDERLTPMDLLNADGTVKRVEAR